MDNNLILPEASNNAALIINCGSSSVKMALIDLDSEQRLAEGLAERVGQAATGFNWQWQGKEKHVELGICDHKATIQMMLHCLFEQFGKQCIVAVGHRVVHGGEKFIEPTLLNATNIAAIEGLSHLAPLHNPVNIIGIKAAVEALPNMPHFAIFDTAFHHAMPEHASLYAVPYHWYSDYAVRRYGFHGTSHHYVAKEAAKRLGKAFDTCNVLTAHLGNGCSATAISKGISVDTTMGMTPLEGLMMGTRSGDVDPGLHAYIAQQADDSLDEITHALNHQSGLLGISGLSNDMRTLLAAADDDHDRAALAIDMFCYRLAKSLAALIVALDGLDAIIFTGGIGEHAAPIRLKTMQYLHILKADVDSERNNAHGKLSNGFINTEHSKLPILVIATDEERMIAHYVRIKMDKLEAVS